uniref:histidine kinase n=1 Tax=Roseihalotalea indica TaxID=2867963 RepID=A0AA49JJN2_9BACT|nr:PAS domain-containing protein [Tunicatimonas sp. TK19036]
MLKVFETVPELYVILSPDLSILTASDAYLAATSTNRQHIVGKTIFDIFPYSIESHQTTSESRLNPFLQEVLASHKPVQTPVQRYEDEEVSEIYWSSLNTPVLDEAGSVQYIIHKVTEASANQQQHIQRLISQERSPFNKTSWKQIVDFIMQAPVGIGIFLGKDHLIELINPLMSEIMGRTPGQVIGKPVFEALPELEGQGFEEILSQVLTKGEPIDFKEAPVTLKREGELISGFYNTVYQPLKNALGEVIGIINVATDVTEQVGARQKVEQSERQLRILTNALPVLISYLDHEEKYRFVNQAYQEWFHKSPDELLGRTILEVVGKEAYQAAKKYIEGVLKGERLDFEARMPYRDDFVKYIHTSYVPDMREGKVVGFYALINDVTEQVKNRQALENLNQELAAANEELSTTNQELSLINADMDNFIYTASHDLRAPITNIEGLMTALLRNLSEENRQKPIISKLAELITNSVERFKKTIYELSQVTKIQREGNEDVSQVDITVLIREIILDMAAEIAQANAQFDLDLQTCAPISFSVKNARSVIYNLISNAIKYRSPDRQVVIRVRCHAVGGYLILTVQDNGLGMDLADESKIFGMFKRLHDHVEGSGVGLYIVKKIMDVAGGKIEVQSAVDQGTTFKVYFKQS